MPVKEASPHIMPQDLDWVPIDHEVLKRTYDEFVSKSGADIVFNTLLAGVRSDGEGRVTSIVTAGRSGLQAYQASVYIDCTGDADLVAWAGGAVEHGAPNGSLMPASLCFVLTNVDEYAFRYDRRSGLCYGTLQGTNPKSVIHEIAKDPRYPLITDTHMNPHLIGPRTVGFNSGHLWQVDARIPARYQRDDPGPAVGSSVS